jgi:hypothetical protein
LIVDFYQRETPVKMGSKRTCGGAAAGSQRFRTSSQTLDDGSQPKVTDAKRDWLSLPHMHKSSLDFLKADIQVVKRGFLPSMSASSPY